MTTTFETARIGDKVWSMGIGWGEITDTSHSAIYPIYVHFQSGEYESYTLGGAHDAEDKTQYLFWDKIVIVAPVKPLPDLEVDAKVFVWGKYEYRLKRHFSHFENGVLHTFDSGDMSWTGESTSPWDNWELAE